MPYFIFAIQPFARLQPLGACPTFPDASRQAKQLRAAEAPGAARRIRIIYAENELAAEDLLLQPPREAPPEGDD